MVTWDGLPEQKLLTDRNSKHSPGKNSISLTVFEPPLARFLVSSFIAIAPQQLRIAARRLITAPYSLLPPIPISRDPETPQRPSSNSPLQNRNTYLPQSH